MAQGNGRHWPWIIGGLMAVVIGANLVLIYVANSDPSFAVEEDYYRKAQAWDEERAQRGANAELGWTIEPGVDPSSVGGGMAHLTATVRDADGDPIEDAHVHLETFHNARASTILRADLKNDGGGVYSTELPMRRPGLWELRFEVTRREQRFTLTTIRELGSR